MTLDQEFPASIEAQMLGGNGSDTRPTANVCSPGTHYVMNDEVITVHCTNSVSETYHGDQWVSWSWKSEAVNPSDTLSMGILSLSIPRCSSILVTRMRSDLLRRVHQYRSTVDISPCRQRVTRLRSEPLSFCRLINERLSKKGADWRLFWITAGRSNDAFGYQVCGIVRCSGAESHVGQRGILAGGRGHKCAVSNEKIWHIVSLSPAIKH